MSEEYQPELGQALFGNPVGIYDVSDFVEALVSHIFGEIERVYWNTQQKQWQKDEELTLWSFLEYRPYYWGECACGFDELEMQWEEEHRHKSDCYQVLCWREIAKYDAQISYHSTSPLADCFYVDEEPIKVNGHTVGVSTLLTPRTDNRELYDLHRKFEEETRKKYCERFGLSYPNGCAVHCTCGHSREYSAWRATNDHSLTCPLVQPNFKFEDVELRWYKHFGRGMSANVQKTEVEWRAWFNRCLKAIRDQDADVD